MDGSKPSCFGISEKCMPRDENGIIQPQENCRHCDHLRDCLQSAIASRGGVERIKSDSVAQSGAVAGSSTAQQPGGIIGTILRWSERKRAAQKSGAD